MEFLASLIANSAATTGSGIIQSAFSQSQNSEDKMTIDQIVAIGLLKSYPELFPEISKFEDSILAFVEDYETLRYTGLSNDVAIDIVHFIYFPRTFLIQQDYLNERFVTGLDQSQVKAIVNNSLRVFLKDHGVSVEEDLNFNISGFEDGDPLLDLL